MRPGTSYPASYSPIRIAVFAAMAFVACGTSGDTSGGGQDGGTSKGGPDGALRGSDGTDGTDDGASDTGPVTVDAPAGSSDADAGTHVTADVAAACAAYAQAYCGRYAACSGVDFGVDYGTTAVCEQRISQLLCPRPVRGTRDRDVFRWLDAVRFGDHESKLRPVDGVCPLALHYGWSAG